MTRLVPLLATLSERRRGTVNGCAGGPSRASPPTALSGPRPLLGPLTGRSIGDEPRGSPSCLPAAAHAAPMRPASLAKRSGGGHDPRKAQALLDTAPLAGRLDRIIDWERLYANVGDGGIAAIGVVATSSSARHSTLLLDAAESPAVPTRRRRACHRLRPYRAGGRHVLASSATPCCSRRLALRRPPQPRRRAPGPAGHGGAGRESGRAQLQGVIFEAHPPARARRSARRSA